MGRRSRRASKPARRGGDVETTVTRFTAPESRLRSLFTALEAAAEHGDDAMLRIGEVDELVRFDAALLVRGVNALKSVRLLLEQAHWEFAAAAVRQLYELVLNVEYLADQPDREAAALRYTKFGLLQAVRHQHASILYAQRTGRPIDTERLATLDSMLEHTFPEYRLKDRSDGSRRWAPSWSGKNIRQLAEASSNSLRKDQYELLFTVWSEETHAAPSAMLDGVLRRADADWIEDAVATDDTEIVETAAVALTLFFELWSALPHLPPFDREKVGGWMREIVAQHPGLGRTRSA